MNGIEPIVFSPIGIKLNIPGNFDNILFDLFDFEGLVYELKKRFIRYLVFAGKITRNNIMFTQLNFPNFRYYLFHNNKHREKLLM